MSVRLRYAGTTVDGRMSAAEYRATAKPKKSKYRNKPVVVDGVRIDSKREARRYAELQALERAGRIQDLRRQWSFELAPSVRFEDEKKAKPALRVIVDFYYYEKGSRVVEDVKSPATAKTAAWRIKRHLLKSIHGLDVRIVK